MGRLTMVMRCGIPKDKAENMQYTLIDENYNFHRLTGVEILKALSSKKHELTNMGLVKGKLVSTNGAIDKYTLVNAKTGLIEGKATGVVLNRVEAKGKLVGFTIFNSDGTLAEVNVETAVRIHKSSGLANSKIRATSSGDSIQSISGSYPLRVLDVKKASDGKIDIDLVFLGSAIGGGKKAIRYAGVIVNAESAAEFSKILTKLDTLNNKTIKSILEVGAPKSIKDTLGNKRTGTAGVYTVIPFENLIKLASGERSSIKCGVKSFMIACTDYDAGGDETNITFSNKFKVLDKQEGTEKATESLKKYVEIAHAKLRELGLK